MFTRRFLILCLAIAICAIPVSGLGPLGGVGTFDLYWHTMDSGGGVSTGGVFDLHGVMGQPDAGTTGTMTGDSFTVSGGFLAASSVSCRADTNGDGAVNVPDLLDVLNGWGLCPLPCPGDLNGDDVVNVPDLLELLAAWGPCP